MNYDLIKRVFGQTDISASEKLILLALVSHRNDTSGQCNPSLDLLCTECSLSRQGVINVLERLATRRLIETEPGGGRGKNNSYVLFPDDETLGRVQISEPENGAKTVNGVDPLARETVNGVDPFENVNSQRGLPFSPLNSQRRCIASNEQYSSSSASSEIVEKNIVPILRAFDDICDVDCDALSCANQTEVPKVTEWLLTKFGDSETAAGAMREQFSRWDKTNPPHPKQIRSDWKRMERLRNQKTDQKPDESHQPSSSDGRRHVAPASNNPTRQRVQSRQQLAAQLAAKYRNGGAD